MNLQFFYKWNSAQREFLLLFHNSGDLMEFYLMIK